MVRGLSVCNLQASRNNGVYGSTPSWRSHIKLMRNTLITSMLSRNYIWGKYVQGCFLSSTPTMFRQRNCRVQAGWLFKGSGQGLDANSERSESANQDILIFFFQLDLETRVQYALNLEQYEIAQQLRSKITENTSVYWKVEVEISRRLESKRGMSSKSDVQDKALSIIRLRADLQNAIDSENYSLAAQLRDEISYLEAESLAASAKALVYENVNYSFRLGQKVKHKIFGYKAVVCGMDPVCCESSSWKEVARVEKLSRGSNQPFYQVLVDVRADPDLLVAYVPEENLISPEKPDQDRFDHPYTLFLFYGADATGDFIPIKQLREKYNRPRHEIPMDLEDGEQGGET